MKLAEDPGYPLILRLQSLLEQIPIIEKVKIIGDGPSMDEGVDYLIQVRIDKTTYVLACETKNNGQPRFVRSAIKTLRSYMYGREEILLLSSSLPICPPIPDRFVRKIISHFWTWRVMHNSSLEEFISIIVWLVNPCLKNVGFVQCLARSQLKCCV